ncbi:ribonuclease Y [Thiohalorhabdus methylotrophus]|uniref:Ribonuclease Y n=1 Tax=Thiohalorhabdus methylotrophus TaxID=3242694 RepID=A0ABV4TVL3_9GAMM
MVETLIGLAIGLLIGAGGMGAGTYIWARRLRREQQARLDAERERSERELEERLERREQEIRREAEDKAEERAKDRESESNKRLEEVAERERHSREREEKVIRKLEALDEKETHLVERENRLEQSQKELEEKRQELDGLEEERRKRLEEVSGYSLEDARKEMVAVLKDDAQREADSYIREVEADAKARAQAKATEIMATAIQRWAGEYVAERTVSVVNLPGDEMKGRIIGREGRNIRALERELGVDIIVDDTPGAVVVSCFNPMRRTIAVRVLEELVEDGRIHPERIEKAVKKQQETMDAEVKEAGENALMDADVRGVPEDLVNILGQLKFRTSYTQNVLYHSIEVAHFAGIMASELGLDPVLARRAGLLHDIGKAVDHEHEGGHAAIGGDLGRKYKEKDEVVNAIEGHHFDVTSISPYTPLVHAADALSAARPGARREQMTSYIKRLEDLEEIAGRFPGVAHAYALQAGRELRVIARQDEMDDQGAFMLSRKIAHEIEDELTYPGEIKVTVIRETRATEVAH